MHTYIDTYVQDVNGLVSRNVYQAGAKRAPSSSAAAAESAAAAADNRADEAVGDGIKLRVLVVDDDSGQRMVLQYFDICV